VPAPLNFIYLFNFLFNHFFYQSINTDILLFTGENYLVFNSVIKYISPFIYFFNFFTWVRRK